MVVSGGATAGAVTAAGSGGSGPGGRPRTTRVVRHFATLKLRILAHGFRGRPARVALFVVGILSALYLAGVGFLGFAASAAGDADVRLMVAAYGGAMLVIGSVLLPLVWFGVDDSLDPARMALLPLSRRQIVAGLLVGALLGVPAMGLFAATAGLLVPAFRHGGVAAGAAQAVGSVAGLLLCVSAARAVTSAFATMLRSRRVRDLAGILLATLAALIAPLQFAVISATQNADWDRLTAVARVVGWTPLGAAYTVGYEVAEGAPLAAGAKLLITLATLAVLLWWWSRSLESAMVGTTASGPGRGGRPPRGGPVRMLLPRALPGLPATPAGAMVARELRYWWRDAKRRSNLITVVAMGFFVPLILSTNWFVRFDGDDTPVVTQSSSPLTLYLAVLFVGAFAASVLANQFGFDGTSYSGHLIAHVPGRRELATRAAAYSVYLVPVLALISVTLAVVRRDPTLAPAAWGLSLAGFGCSLAVSHVVSILAAYPLPEGSNPFAVSTGSGVAKSLLALVGLAAAYALASPVLVAAVYVDEAVWTWLAVPVGLGYGATAAALGAHLAGDLLDRRAPEVLGAVSPRR